MAPKPESDGTVSHVLLQSSIDDYLDVFSDLCLPWLLEFDWYAPPYSNENLIISETRELQ